MLHLPLLALVLTTQRPTAPEGELYGPEETFPVEVSFEVAERLGYGKYRPLPGLAVELGLGFARDGAWGLHHLPAEKTLESGADGLVRATFQVPAKWRSDRDLRFFARVVEPGWQRVVASRGLSAYDRPVRLVPLRGGTLHGTLRDAAGVPVEGAAVGIDYGSERGPHAPVKSDEAGRFTLHWTSSMASNEVHLVTRKAGVGAGESPPFRLAAELRLRPLELRLEPGVRLAGRVVDPRGRAVPGLGVTVHPSSGLPRGLRVYAGEGREGLLVAQTTTDVQGVFEVQGMAPGRYSIFGHTGSPHLKAEELGAPLGTLTAPSTEPDLVTFAEPRLEVVVVNHEGRTTDLATALGGSHGEGAPQLEVFRLESPDARPRGYAPSVHGRVAGPVASYPTEPGASYLVRWSQPGVPLSEVRVQAGFDPRTQVSIQLEPPARPSRVLFRVLGPGGGPPADEPAVHVSSTESGLWIASSIEAGLPPSNHFGEEDPDTWSTTLPPGRYEVEAWVPKNAGCVVFSPMDRTPLTPDRQVFDLVAGQDLELELRLGPAGHLDIQPTGPAPLSPKEVDAMIPKVRHEHYTSIDTGPEVVARLLEQIVAGRPLLIAADGRRVPFEEFELFGLGSFEHAPDFAGLVAQGYAVRGLQPIAPGEWSLVIERAGELLLEQRVTIRAGEVTTVQW